MLYTTFLPADFMDKGNYTVRVEMWATDGARMTDLEGTVWVEGRRGEGTCVVC